MRVEALALLLLAGSAAAHGLHDLRGEISLSEERLRIDLETTPSQRASGVCLRYLDELRVLGPGEDRFVGRLLPELEPGSCVLEYAFTKPVESLELQLQPRRVQREHAERLVLAVKGRPELLILTERGNRERLSRPAFEP